MDEIIQYLRDNYIEFEQTTHGVAYAGFYYWHHISNESVYTEGDINHYKRKIRNNQMH